MDPKELESQLKEFFGDAFTLESLCNPQISQTRINFLKVFLEKYLKFDIERILSLSRDHLSNKNADSFTEFDNVLMAFALMGNYALSGIGIENFMMTDITKPDSKRWCKILAEIVKALNIMKCEKALFDQFRTKISDIVAMSQKSNMKIEFLKETIENAKSQLAIYNESNDSEKYFEIENADKFVKKNLEINSIEHENVKKSLKAIEEKNNILAIKINKLSNNNKRLEENIVASPNYLLEDISCASKQLLEETKKKEDVIAKHKLAKDNIASIEEQLTIILKICQPTELIEQSTKDIKLIKQEIEKVGINLNKDMHTTQKLTNQINEQKLKNSQFKEKLEEIAFAHRRKLEKLDSEALTDKLKATKTSVRNSEEKTEQLQKDIEQAQLSSQKWQIKMEQLQKSDEARYDELLEMARTYLPGC